ncbi:hypothetical protein EJ06DRAFT_581710 [Trichodelitschia bisporula]|uniref:RNase H type-1 domain-containing protein n=1 Tax=Trichodelitschia bisporula TaxID=703511 RepID=A0A6G1HXG5_9PEZI|nr:hypothetical protein EJ06DRAFT_581710 [Trichodelitschia bisporula]
MVWWKDRQLLVYAEKPVWPVETHVNTCKGCGWFYLHCPKHDDIPLTRRPCHHKRVIFVAGSCISEDDTNAIKDHFSKGYNPRKKKKSQVVDEDDDEEGDEEDEDEEPEDDTLAKGVPSKQRAVLLAVLYGLNIQILTEAFEFEEDGEKLKSAMWIVATDSEYVMRGLTEWLPKWRWETTPETFKGADGNLIENGNVFLKIERLLDDYEHRGKQVNRFLADISSENTLANKLARKGEFEGSFEGPPPPDIWKYAVALGGSGGERLSGSFLHSVDVPYVVLATLA